MADRNIAKNSTSSQAATRGLQPRFTFANYAATQKYHNVYGTCHFDECEGHAGRNRMFCDDHDNLNSLSFILYGQTEMLLQKRIPLTAVYLVGGRDLGAFKVGVADNVSKRVASLQTASPNKIRIYGAIYTSRDLAFRLEKIVHAKLHEFGLHLSGEWFDADPEDIYEVIVKLATSSGVPWVAPKDYLTMIANHRGMRQDITHYPEDVRKVVSSMLATSLFAAP